MTLAAQLAAAPARAEYPERPVRVLEPFPPGGAVDIVTRLVAARLADDLGMPASVIDKLAAACDRAVRAPELIERFRRDGIDPGGGTPKSFGERIGREIAQWRELIQSVKINVD